MRTPGRRRTTRRTVHRSIYPREPSRRALQVWIASARFGTRVTRTRGLTSRSGWCRLHRGIGCLTGPGSGKARRAPTKAMKALAFATGCLGARSRVRVTRGGAQGFAAPGRHRDRSRKRRRRLSEQLAHVRCLCSHDRLTFGCTRRRRANIAHAGRDKPPCGPHYSTPGHPTVGYTAGVGVRSDVTQSPRFAAA